MRKDIVIPAVPLLAGVAGFVLRRWELAAGFEPDTGLAVPGCPAALLLTVLTAVTAAALIVLARGRLRSFQGYDDAMLTHDPGMRALGNAAGFLVLLASAWELQELVFTGWPAVSEAAEAARVAGQNALPLMLSGLGLPLLSVAMGLLSALSLLMLTRNNYWGERRGDRSAFLLLPAFGGCLWLVLTYRDMSSDPVVAGYACHLLALVAVTLALYYTVALSFGKHPRPRAALYFSLLAVYLCLTALADGLELTQTLLLLSAVLWFTGQSFVLLHNGARLPWPLPPMRPDRDDEEDGDDSPGGREN